MARLAMLKMQRNNMHLSCIRFLSTKSCEDCQTDGGVIEEFVVVVVVVVVRLSPLKHSIIP